MLAKTIAVAFIGAVQIILTCLTRIARFTITFSMLTSAMGIAFIWTLHHP
jgi:ribose/xylose/arabinose/galactoside ABC-type transport system permease subunit